MTHTIAWLFWPLAGAALPLALAGTPSRALEAAPTAVQQEPCQHCVRAASAWSPASISCPGDPPKVANISSVWDGGNDGDCNVPTYCDERACEWTGTVDVQNTGEQTIARVEIWFGGVLKKGVNNVVPQQTAQWNVTGTDLNEATVECSKEEDTTSEVKVKVMCGGSTPESKQTLRCKKCGSG